MVLQTHIKLNLSGEHFSPNRLSQLTATQFDEVIEKDVTLMTTGRYKYQTAPYGSASLLAEAKAGEDYNEIIHTILATFYHQTQGYLDQCQIEQITLWITLAFDDEGTYGFEIDPDNLLLLGKIGATLAVNIDQ